MAKLLYLLMILVGLVLLVAPGIWLGTRDSLFPLIMADGQHRPIRALQVSSEMVQGRTGRVLVVLLVLVLLNLLAACFLGLGLLLSIPTTSLAMAYLYRRLPPKGST